MTRQLLFSMIVLLICQNAISQEAETNLKRNLIKGSIASSGNINSMISIDYERNLIHTNKIKLNIEGTFGKYFQHHNSDSYQSYPGFPSVTSSINSLFGKRSHFFEASLGARYSFINDDFYNDIHSLFPVINIGYRYQNYYKKGLIFRVFIGTTGVGLSTGLSF
jgi:hypothetical protein